MLAYVFDFEIQSRMLKLGICLVTFSNTGGQKIALIATSRLNLFIMTNHVISIFALSIIFPGLTKCGNEHDER